MSRKINGARHHQSDIHGAQRRIMAECDRMEAMLGAWLLTIAPRFARSQSSTSSTALARSLAPSLWRTLIHIWATSPGVRQRFSYDARGGMMAAMHSMDDDLFIPLVAGLLEEGAAGAPLRPAA